LKAQKMILYQDINSLSITCCSDTSYILNKISENVNIKELNLYSCELEKIPENIAKLRNLKSLKLFNNKIKMIPYWISELDSLSTIDLSNNPIDLDSVMNVLKLISSLENLYLEGNFLFSIPKDFENLKSLKKISLNNNLFDHIPSELTKIKNLQELRIGINQITYIDSFDVVGLLNLNNLKILDLYKNPLRNIDNSFVKLSWLEQLSLASTLIERLPINFHLLEKLEVLEIQKTKLKIDINVICKMKNIKMIIDHKGRFTIDEIAELKNCKPQLILFKSGVAPE